MSWLEVIVREDIYIPQHLKSNGKIYLDTDPDISLETVKNNILLNKDGENNGDATLSMNLPYSPINNTVLSPLIDPAIVGQSFGSLRCEVYARGDLLPFGKLRVISRSDTEASFVVEFVIGDDHPLKLAQNLSLCKLDFGGIFDGFFFGLNKTDIEAQWDKYEYQDGDPGFYWGFDWFGKVYNNFYFKADDLRPRYSPLHLLRGGFKNLGWKFSSPILETSFFRKVWLYLSDGKYGGNTNKKLSRFKFLLALEDVGHPISYYNNGSAIPLSIVYDNYERAQSYPPNILIGAQYFLNEEILIDYEFDVSQMSRVGIINFGILASYYDGLNGFQSILDFSIDISVDDEKVYKGTVSAESRGKTGFYWSVTQIPPGVIINKYKIYNNPKSLRYYEGQYIDMTDPLSCDITLYDLLKGMQHMVGGVIDVDYARKEVSLHVSEDVVVHGESVPGYYIKTPSVNGSESIICKSRGIEAPDYDQPRYINIGFKKSSDAYIKHLEYAEDTQPFEKTIDIGPSFDPDTYSDRNPLLEPTRMIAIDRISKDFPVHLPSLLDNYNLEDPDFSYDLGPRIGICVGLTKQKYKDDDGVVLGTPKLLWYDEELELFPTFFNDVREENVDFLDEFNNPIDPELYLAYGDGENSFWDKFLMRRLLTRYLSQAVNYSIWMNPSTYSLFSLRNRVSIVYWYEHISGMVDKLRYNHRTGEGVMTLYTPLESYSLSDVSVIEESGEDTIICSENKPRILITPGGTITVSLAGRNVSDISQVVFEQRAVDANDVFVDPFATLTNTTSISAEFANPLKKYQVRMTVKYAPTNGVSCPDYSIVETIDPCKSFVEPVIQNIFSVANKLGGKRVNLNNSIFSDSIASITSAISINGGAPQAYTIDPVTLYGTYVYNLDPNIFPNFVLQSMVITFSSGCVYTLPSPIGFSINLINRIESTEEGTLEIKRSGMGTSPGEGPRYVPDISSVILGAEPVSTSLYYRNDRTSSYGEPWNRGVGPVGYNPEFKVVFYFGNGLELTIGWQEP